MSTISLAVPPLRTADDGDDDDDGVAKLDAWLRAVCWDATLPGSAASSSSSSLSFEVHRIKGRLVLADGRIMHLQGVREIFELTEAGAGNDDGAQPPAEGKIVVIGRGMQADAWRTSLTAALA